MIKTIGPARMMAAGAVGVLALALGYPAAFVGTYGLDARVWPPVRESPRAWFSPAGADLPDQAASFVVHAVSVYGSMVLKQAEAYPDGGQTAFLLILAAAVGAGTIVVMGGRLEPLRHASKRFGDARFASARDLRRMRRGLEIGIDPATGRAVRVQLEGNVVTIAPPRSGKTSGLVLPNLTFPEVGAWAGPCVVIDPKGDVFRAVRRRREALGRKVRCLDPLNIAGGTDRWNPLLARDPRDILYLQAMARALLPDSKSSSDASEFFKDRAVAIVVAALAVSIGGGHCDVAEAAALVRDPDALRAALAGHTDAVAKDALAILDSPDDRSRGAILTTAAQVFSWAIDERMTRIVSEHTFELADLCRGDTDLFIVLPADSRRTILAPFVRWLLADLFSAVRVRRPDERILCFIDEAAVLGRFDAILNGVGELPGFGISLWTIWQTESQIAELYDRTGADTIIGTAEAVILFNLSSAQGAERQRWSEALGTYTGSDPRPLPGGKAEITDQPVAVPLVPAADLAQLTQHQSLVLLNSGAYTTDPLRLRKTSAHRDSRFAGLLDGVEPVGPTRA